jgi:hypothetical protein
VNVLNPPFEMIQAGCPQFKKKKKKRYGLSNKAHKSKGSSGNLSCCKAYEGLFNRGFVLGQGNFVECINVFRMTRYTVA